MRNGLEGRKVTVTDLKEYPEGYVGRKTYVTVSGTEGMVPKYMTYKGADLRYHLLPEYGGDLSGLAANAPYVMPDKPGYMSPMDRTVVEGRSAHREHMRKHGVYEAGDMKLGEGGRNTAPMERASVDIRRAMQEVASR